MSQKYIKEIPMLMLEKKDKWLKKNYNIVIVPFFLSKYKKMYYYISFLCHFMQPKMHAYCLAICQYRPCLVVNLIFVFKTPNSV